MGARQTAASQAPMPARPCLHKGEHLRAAEHGRAAPQLYSREFLVRRPLLEALEADDDVNAVHANFDADADVLERAAAAG